MLDFYKRKPSPIHDRLYAMLKCLPSDFAPWGERDRDTDEVCADCSCGCDWYIALEDVGDEHLSMDWGVCSNPQSPRAGLLTFEHQGCREFKCSEEGD